jgi:hypothetical protein
MLHAVLTAAVIVAAWSVGRAARWWWAGAATVVWVCVHTGAGATPAWAFRTLAVAAIAAVYWPAARRPGALIALSVAVAAASAQWLIGSWSSVLVRSGGDDWLTYESHARSILETGTLEGGEAVFYYQPLYRYAKFLLRLAFGESEFLVHVASTAAMNGGILVMTARLAPELAGQARLLGCAAVVAMLSMVTAGWIHTITLRGLSEPVAWALFPWSIALLFGATRTSSATLGVTLAAAGALTRLNHLPGVLMTCLAAALREWPRHLTLKPRHAVILVALLLLPLAHNLGYGGAFVLTTNSLAIPGNLVIRPDALLDAGPEARDTMATQLGRMFNTAAGWWPSDQLTTGLRAAEALWLVAIGMAAWRRTWFHTAIAALPAAYLGVHLLYQIHVYYPRHIISAHLAMAVAGALAALPSGRRPASEDSAATSR